MVDVHDFVRRNQHQSALAVCAQGFDDLGCIGRGLAGATGCVPEQLHGIPISGLACRVDVNFTRAGKSFDERLVR
jgi:hypothetical protein